MHYKKIFLALVAVFGMVSTTNASVVDDAKKLLSNGNAAQALTLLQKELKAKPKDGQLNYLSALCHERMGDEASAISLMRVAESRQVAGASEFLAEKAFAEYRFDEVSNHIEAYRRAVAKSGKTLSDRLKSIQERVFRAKSMLDRVERIVIIDSVSVDKNEFFKAYRLAAGVGSLKSVASLPDGMDGVENSPVFRPESEAFMLWSKNIGDSSVIVASSRLTDGSWESPEPIADNLNEGGSAICPFMMPDGATLYFANNGENSIGGYDIFVSRRDEGNYLNPQNLGMPYNSIYDDYMLVIDEFTGVGWWATDRNRLGDKITIYLFIPSEVRNNYAADEQGIALRALARNFHATWQNDADYGELLAKVASLGGNVSSSTKAETFRFALPGGRVASYFDDFRSADARRLMSEYLDAVADIERTSVRLRSLRSRFAQGDNQVADEILKMEKHLKLKRSILKDMSNEIVRLETGQTL